MYILLCTRTVVRGVRGSATRRGRAQECGHRASEAAATPLLHESSQRSGESCSRLVTAVIGDGDLWYGIFVFVQ